MSLEYFIYSNNGREMASFSTLCPSTLFKRVSMRRYTVKPKQGALYFVVYLVLNF